MQTVEALVELTFEELRQELERIRGNMPTRTLYHWLNRLDLIPNSEGLYTLDDLELLKRLHRFLKRVPNINKFRRIIQQEMNHYTS